MAVAKEYYHYQTPYSYYLGGYQGQPRALMQIQTVAGTPWPSDRIPMADDLFRVQVDAVWSDFTPWNALVFGGGRYYDSTDYGYNRQEFYTQAYGEVTPVPTLLSWTITSPVSGPYEGPYLYDHPGEYDFPGSYYYAGYIQNSTYGSVFGDKTGMFFMEGIKGSRIGINFLLRAPALTEQWGNYQVAVQVLSNQASSSNTINEARFRDGGVEIYIVDDTHSYTRTRRYRNPSDITQWIYAEDRPSLLADDDPAKHPFLLYHRRNGVTLKNDPSITVTIQGSETVGGYAEVYVTDRGSGTRGFSVSGMGAGVYGAPFVQYYGPTPFTSGTFTSYAKYLPRSRYNYTLRETFGAYTPIVDAPPIVRPHRGVAQASLLGGNSVYKRR